MKVWQRMLMLVLFVNAPAAVPAGSGFGAPDPAALRVLLQLSGMGDIGAQLGPPTAQQIIVALRGANPDLPARADGIIHEVVVTFMRQRADRDDVVGLLIPIYSRHLSSADVRQLTEFYRSPIGRKLVQAIPAISAESGRAGQRWVESIVPSLQSRLSEKLRAEKLIP